MRCQGPRDTCFLVRASAFVYFDVLADEAPMHDRRLHFCASLVTYLLGLSADEVDARFHSVVVDALLVYSSTHRS